MSDIVSDDAFTRAVIQVGAATLDQVETARMDQVLSAKRGILEPVSDILVRHGVITRALKENLEKKVLAAQKGGIQQLGNYKLLKKLGEGAMGVVYLAEDALAGRKAALKVLSKRFSDNTELLTRFRREARAAGKLSHVNIVSAFTVGEELGNHYYAMEYFDGEPLDTKLKRDGCLHWQKAIEITRQIARGLNHAHKNGLIHRDIKPSNIFITTDGVAKILDLGLSKNIFDSGQTFNTQTGVTVGTPHYISPEQARGDKDVDGRTDIYSLGATLYHLITGKTPFQGSTAAMVMMKHLSEELSNPQDTHPQTPDGVVQVIRKMMAKATADRYANCLVLLEDLESVATGQMPSGAILEDGKSSIAMRHVDQTLPAGMNNVEAHPATPPLPVAKLIERGANMVERRRRSDRNRMPIYVGGALALFGLLCLAYTFWYKG